ncbi:MAG TPA: DUF4845 domain-containing protein [Nevskiaceae bacterium]|nr:DUF4845 domain-containing protein [Nevskiaceae bacterium]
MILQPQRYRRASVAPHAMRGMALWQIVIVVLIAGFFGLVTMKLVPVYLNEMKVSTAVREVAQEPELGASADVHAIRSALSRHWDIDDIEYLDWRDVGISRDDSGTTLSWDYDARVHLFYNIDVVVHFAGSKPMGVAS